MTDAVLQEEIRAAALSWLEQSTRGGEIPLTREQLANDFIVGGVRFPLIDRGRGIRKPAGWNAALSITTAVPKSGGARPYDDVEGPDGLHRYKLRRDELGRSENAGKHSVGVLSGTCWWHGVMTDRADARRCWWRVGFGQAGAAWSGGIQGSPMIAWRIAVMTLWPCLAAVDR